MNKSLKNKLTKLHKIGSITKIEVRDGIDDHVSFNAITKEVGQIVTDNYHKAADNPKSHKIDTNDIEYVQFEDSLGHIFIAYKNGNTSGSRMSNFSDRDLGILRKLNKTDFEIELEEMDS